MSGSPRRLAAAAALTLTAVFTPVALAAPAHADAAECSAYLDAIGSTGEEITAACEAGEKADVQKCLMPLIQAKVDPISALAACVLALKPAQEA